ADHGVRATQAAHGVRGTQADPGVRATQADHGVRATQAGPPRTVLRPPLRQAVAFAGPAFLVSVGYMDPGNWGTDLAAGSKYGYTLLWVLVVSNAIAIFLQYLSAKAGIATGRHLAALIGERLPQGRRIAYWALAETAMLATEMAE